MFGSVEAATGAIATRLKPIDFDGQTSQAITARITQELIGLAHSQGARVRTEFPVWVPNVHPERPSFANERWRGRIDVVMYEPNGRVLAVEIDGHGERWRSAEKLRWAVHRGHLAVWVRWGRAPDLAAPPGIGVVALRTRGARRRNR